MFVMPVIETSRLLIREIKVKDAFDMYEYAHIKEIGYSAGWEPHTSVSYSRMVIRMQRQKKIHNVPCVFAIILKSENKMIGTCELYNISGGFDRAELGYTIAYKYWGNGYAKEAASALVDYGFKDLLLNKIIVTTFPSNVASLHVINHIGFKHVKLIKNGYTLFDGSIHDIEYFELTREDYIERTK